MGRRLALLIATYEYEDTGLRRLTTPAHDAEALAGVLEDPEIAGFEVQTLINAPTHEVGEAIAEFYAESRRDDLTLLYFTGHGLKDDNGRLHLAMSNTKRDRLRFTALSAQLVDEAMSDSLSRQKILILDCCYSGSYETQQFAKSDSAVHTLEKLGGRGRTVLTASDSTQYAFEGSTIHGEAAQSVFTRHLVEGLRDGTADLDGDGDITVDELYNYVFDRVTAEQPNQRPKKLDQVEGRTIIAANVNWSLPPHLADAVVSPLPGAREAAVGQLAQLRWSGNDLVRRTANRWLEELVDDDSRAVSAAAREALDAPAQPMPVATPMLMVAASPRTTSPAGRVRQSGPPNIALGTLIAGSVRRWAGRLIPTTVPWPIYSLSLLAALALVAAVAVGISQRGLNAASLGYFVVAAVAACLSVVLQRRHGTVLVAGTTAYGLFGAAMLIGWSTKRLLASGTGALMSEIVVAVLAYAGHAAWIAAGAAALWHLRSEPAVDVRRLRGWRAWTILGLGGVAAAVQLWILFYLTYNSVLAFRSGTPFPVAALQIVVAELAVAGPLIALFMRRGQAFLGGWVLTGFAAWIGVDGGLLRFAERTPALIALLAVWSLLAGVLIVGRRREGVEDASTGPARRWIVVIAAVLPVVLGGAVVVVDPRGPTWPSVVALAVAPGNDVLYGVDSANGTVLKINTNSLHQEGNALEVGSGPYGVVLAPDGHRLYVANARANSVSVIDVDNWQVLGEPIPVGPEPIELALSPETKRLFVLSEKAATITVIDTEKRTTVGGPVSGGATPSALTVGQDGKRLYVASHDGSSVAVLDTLTMRPARSPYQVTGQLMDLSMTRDNYLYVLSEDSYSVVNTNVDSPRPKPVSLPGRSTDAVLTDDDRRYVVLGKPETAPLKDLITVIDTEEREAIGTAEGGGGLSVEVVVSHDNQRIYAAGYNFEHNVLIVDATIPKAIGAISLGK